MDGPLIPYLPLLLNLVEMSVVWYLTICLLAAVIGFILNAPLMTAGTITVCALVVLVALIVPRRPTRSGSTDCIDSIVYDEIARHRGGGGGAAHIIYAEGSE